MSLTSKQLTDRLSMITGSDASAIEGTSPYTSAYGAWATKTGRVKDTFKGNNKTKLGSWLEGFAVQEYEAFSGRKCRMVHRTLRHKKYDFIGGHIDRLVEGDPNRGVECKAVTSDGMGRWLDEDDNLIVPPYYISRLTNLRKMTSTCTWNAVSSFGSMYRLKLLQMLMGLTRLPPP